jgi:hypothetical protein
MWQLNEFNDKLNVNVINQFTALKTPTKCTSLYHIFTSIDPYICFGLCKNHHQGVSKLHIFTSNGISVFIVMQ